MTQEMKSMVGGCYWVEPAFEAQGRNLHKAAFLNIGTVSFDLVYNQEAAAGAVNLVFGYDGLVFTVSRMVPLSTASGQAMQMVPKIVQSVLEGEGLDPGRVFMYESPPKVEPPPPVTKEPTQPAAKEPAGPAPNNNGQKPDEKEEKIEWFPEDAIPILPLCDYEVRKEEKALKGRLFVIEPIVASTDEDGTLRYIPVCPGQSMFRKGPDWWKAAKGPIFLDPKEEGEIEASGAALSSIEFRRFLSRQTVYHSPTGLGLHKEFFDREQPRTIMPTTRLIPINSEASQIEVGTFFCVEDKPYFYGHHRMTVEELVRNGLLNKAGKKKPKEKKPKEKKPKESKKTVKSKEYRAMFPLRLVRPGAEGDLKNQPITIRPGERITHRGEIDGAPAFTVPFGSHKLVPRGSSVRQLEQDGTICPESAWAGIFRTQRLYQFPNAKQVNRLVGRDTAKMSVDLKRRELPAGTVAHYFFSAPLRMIYLVDQNGEYIGECGYDEGIQEYPIAEGGDL